MRRAGPRLRWTAVLLLLALRADERSVRAEGGLRRPRRIGSGEARAAPPDCRVPSPGRAGVREAACEDRAGRRLHGCVGDAYRHLEVRHVPPCPMDPLTRHNPKPPMSGKARKPRSA